jgi:hypothetical protein
MPDRYDKHDPIADLIAACHAGMCARIRYAQSVLDEPSTRVIVPTKLIETPDGLLVRALQVAPDKGIRMFQVEKIVDVEPSDTPLGEHEPLTASFVGGEFYESTPRVVERPTRDPEGRPDPEETRRPRQTAQQENDPPEASATPRNRDRAPVPREPTQSPLMPQRAAWSQEWFRAYTCELRDALVDGTISDDEVKRLLGVQDKLKLTFEQICAAHIYLLAQEMVAVSIDGLATDMERTYLSQLEQSLGRLGWPIGM